MKGRINRGVVHVVPNTDGSVYRLSDNHDELIVNIQQISIWTEQGHMHKKVAHAVICGPIDHMLDAGWHRGSTLPGNIITVQQTEPVDIDNPEDHLLIIDGIYIKTDIGSYIWQYSYYCDNQQYEPHREIDVLLTY